MEFRFIDSFSRARRFGKYTLHLNLNGPKSEIKDVSHERYLLLRRKGEKKQDC